MSTESTITSGFYLVGGASPQKENIKREEKGVERENMQYLSDTKQHKVLAVGVHGA